MFTGIVEELGKVIGISKRGNITLLTVEADNVLEDSKTGDSIAVNGVCLTVVKKDRNALSFEVMGQTLNITGLGSLRVSDKVNLERSLRLVDRISGHFVLGHIDCMGVIRRKGFVSGNQVFEISAPPQFMKFIIPKGSVALDGISLTVAEKKTNCFKVYIIPHTLKNTTLNFKGPSDRLNIEFDILVKTACQNSPL
jgi:riboflavin synthase